MKRSCFIVLLLFSGCGTGPVVAESEREIVLKHVAVDVGTVGPFTKKAKQEINILSEKDRAEAAALLDRGAVGFLVFPKNSSPVSTGSSGTRPSTRVILVQHGRVVGDFTAP